MKRMLWIVIGVIAVVGAGLAMSATVFATAKESVASSAVYEVARGDLQITLTESGSLVAEKSEKLEPKFDGRATINFLVPEGEEVEKDTVVCRFDAKEAQKALDDLELQLLSAVTAHNAAKTDLEIQQADNITNVEKAKIALHKAEKELERYRDGDAPQEIRKLQIALKEAETNFTKAKKKYEDSLKLMELKYINQTELDDHQITYERTQVQKEEAELAIELHTKYVFPMTMADKQNALDESRRGVETAEKRASSELDKKKVAVTQAEKRVEKLQKSIDDAKEDLANMELKAPAAGIVIYGDPRQPWYRENVKIGGQVHRGYRVITIPVLAVMQVKLAIHEADINKVEPGLVAKVTMETYPGLVLEGKVTKVATIAGSSRPWDSEGDVKKFDVEVTIENKDNLKLKPGISAKVEIQVDTREDALSVPLQCVFLESGKHYVNLQAADGIKRREVEIGTSNDAYVEILAGLDVGDEVLLYNPNLPAATESRGSETDEEPGASTATAPAATTPDGRPQ